MLTADEVLFRYRDERLPEFKDIDIIDVNQRGRHGNTPLAVATARGSIDEVCALLNGGADPNLPGERGVTPLHDAAGLGYVEIAQLLILKGARQDAVAEFGGTPKDWAARQGAPEMLKLFND